MRSGMPDTAEVTFIQKCVMEIIQGSWVENELLKAVPERNTMIA